MSRRSEHPGLAATYFMALVASSTRHGPLHGPRGFEYETWTAFLRTLAEVEGHDGDPTAFAPLATDMLVASVELLHGMAQAAVEERYPPASGMLKVHAALMPDLIASRESTGVDAEPPRHVKALVDRRVDQGRGGDGFSSLIDLLRPGSSRTNRPAPRDISERHTEVDPS